MSTTPFLSVDQRVEYLLAKGYTAEASVSERVKDHLQHNNFHHFLGYARNYGQLVSTSRVDTPVSLDRLVRIIETDKAVSVVLFKALQTLEHQLRAQLVEAHCDLFPATECFLDSKHFMQMSLDRGTPETAIISQILRMREPYVANRIQTFMTENSISGPVERLSPELRKSAVSGFPIWSFVDGLSFGVLADMIITTRPAKDNRSIRDAVATSCGVPRTMLDTQLKALIVLRNQVAHHTRLWMRPTTNSPKLPNLYKKKGRDAGPKSMYVAWLALASFFKDATTGNKLLTELGTLIETDPVYELGVKSPLVQ